MQLTLLQSVNELRTLKFTSFCKFTTCVSIYLHYLPDRTYEYMPPNNSVTRCDIIATAEYVVIKRIEKYNKGDEKQN